MDRRDSNRGGGQRPVTPWRGGQVPAAQALVWAIWVDGRPASHAVSAVASIMQRRFQGAFDDKSVNELVLDAARDLKEAVQGGRAFNVERLILAQAQSDLSFATSLLEDLRSLLQALDGQECVNAGWVRTVFHALEAEEGRRTVGPTERVVCSETGAPLFSQQELEALGQGARELAAMIPAAGKEEVASLLSDLAGVSCPARLDFLMAGDSEALEGMYATTGEQVRAPIGIVPRAWVVRLRATDMEFSFMPARLDFVLEPTVIVASQEHLYWQELGKWRSMPFVAGERDSMHEWSELFGRGPFAHFSNEDLGLDADQGRPEFFDLCRLEEENVVQTRYGLEGANPHVRTSSMLETSKSAYEAAGLLDVGEEVIGRIGKQVFEALAEREDLRGFRSDMGALYWSQVPFMVQGGFTAFLPRGLDPHGQERFRYPSIKMSVANMGEDPLCDPAGIPLKTLMATRGMTLPLFIEPTGTGGGSHMSVMLASMRNWWPHSGAQVVTGMDHGGVTGWRSFPSLADYSSGRPSLVGMEPHPPQDRSVECEAWRQEVASALGAEEDDQEKAKRLESLLESSAGNAEAHLELARCLRRIDGRGEDAVAAADRACALHPCPVNYWIAAMSRHDMGDADGRDEQISLALRQWHDMPGLVKVWRRSTWFRPDRFGEEHETVENYRAALRLMTCDDPIEDANARLAEIWASANRGDYTDSLFARSQMLYLDHPDDLAYWGPMIVLSGQAEDAEEELHPAVVEAATARFGEAEVDAMLKAFELPPVSQVAKADGGENMGPAPEDPAVESEGEALSLESIEEPVAEHPVGGGALTTYVPFGGFSEPGSREALEPDSPHTDAIRGAVLEVLRHEAPVHLGRLYRLVGKKFGYERVHAERRALIAAAIPAGCLHTDPFGDFVWSSPDQRVSWRGARTTPAGVTRPVEEIAPQELGNLLVLLAADSQGLEGDALISAAVTALGVKKRGKKILTRLQAVHEIYFQEGGHEVDSAAEGPSGEDVAPESGAGPAEQWVADYDEAVKIATAEDKHLFVNFSGSDWCGWCIRLYEEVFSHDEFVTQMTRDYVLVSLDFPRSEQAKAEVPNPKRNTAVASLHDVSGYPTVLLMTAEGKVYGRTGYQEGGADAYVGHVSELRARGMKQPNSDGDKPVGKAGFSVEKKGGLGGAPTGGSDSKPQPSPEVERDPRPKDVANVFWNPDYPLFCLQCDKIITPDREGTYDIWYSSNENPQPYHGVFKEEALPSHLFYKFKDRENCKEWCDERVDL